MRRVLTVMLCGALLAGCGSGSEDGGGGAGGDGSTSAAPSAAKLRDDVRASTAVDESKFPAVGGRTLEEVANEIDAAGTQVAFATPEVPVGDGQRIAFGILDETQKFVYGPSVVYIARSPDQKAIGPFPAPADSLVTDPPFRSQTAASEQDPFAAVYEASVDFAKAGEYYVLVVTDAPQGRTGATGTVKVLTAAQDPVPAVGSDAPRVKTDTLASLGGDEKLLDTRVPVSDMHAVSFDEVVGKKPVVLLFATPQLCQSRVCGPVVDIALQLKKTYGDRVEFIHQEVYVDNDLNKGLRPPLRAFKLPTEPWLFAVDTEGRITARLEGSFGFRSMEAAIKSAL